MKSGPGGPIHRLTATDMPYVTQLKTSYSVLIQERVLVV